MLHKSFVNYYKDFIDGTSILRLYQPRTQQKSDKDAVSESE